MKKLTIIACMLASTMAAAQTQAPNGYVHIADNTEGVNFYAHLGSIKPQRFINSTNPARLAIGNFWQTFGGFSRLVANCDTSAISAVRMNTQGGEAAGHWEPAIDGTVNKQLVNVLCAVAYPVKPVRQQGQPV
jgi:hypothetical protein